MTSTLELDLAPLSESEKYNLERCESIIEAGRNQFLETGRALIYIQENKLYRNTDSSFEAYCQRKWGIGRSMGYRCIEAARVVDNLLTIGDTLPQNEAQARPLVGLPPQEQREAWKEAVAESDGKPKASHVKKAAARHKPEQTRGQRPEAREPVFEDVTEEFGGGDGPRVVRVTTPDAPLSPLASHLSPDEELAQQLSSLLPVTLFEQVMTWHGETVKRQPAREPLRSLRLTLIGLLEMGLKWQAAVSSLSKENEQLKARIEVYEEYVEEAPTCARTFHSGKAVSDDGEILRCRQCWRCFRPDGLPLPEESTENNCPACGLVYAECMCREVAAREEAQGGNGLPEIRLDMKLRSRKLPANLYTVDFRSKPDQDDYAVVNDKTGAVYNLTKAQVWQRFEAAP